MIYLDNAATTKPSNRVIKVAEEVMKNDWMNPSALYDGASEVANKIKNARNEIADLIGFKPSEITFTSGATEGNNTVLRDTALNHIIVSDIEHDSVYNTVNSLIGVHTHTLDVDRKGRISTEQLNDILERIYKSRPKCEVPLVTVMSANNEIGTLQDIEKISKICKKYKALFHIDATQTMGKFDLPYNKADFVTASAHKFHGLKGIGFIASKHLLRPYITGGHQENNKRAGTENTIGILTMAEALKESYENMNDNFNKVKDLRDTFKNEITNHVPDIIINSDNDNPYVLNISFKDVNAESLILMLSLKGIYISSGSACNSRGTEVSRILQTIGVPKDYIYGTIRVSFSPDNTFSEAMTAANEIIRCVDIQRKMRI